MNFTLDAPATQHVCEHARAIGFDLCGVARAEEFEELKHFPEWLARGYAGEMNYLRDARRKSARDILPAARSVIVCAMNYNAPLPYSTAAMGNHDSSRTHDGKAGAANEMDSPRGWISRYAWGDDYHDVLKRKLDELVAWMRSEFGGEFQARTYVDTGPVLERVAAKHGGLGWLAKNTCLINQQLGSWLFLGVILTDLDLTTSLGAGDAAPDLCGTCTRCIDACPTDALVKPYVLDARRCISYLTIELRGEIPAEFRPQMGAMVFGCDICQDVCPWNRRAPATRTPEYQPRRTSTSSARNANTNAAENENSLFRPALEWLISLDENEFREVFRRSPVKRAKWRGLLRNACVAVGNSGLTSANPAHSRIIQRLKELVRSDDVLIAKHASWALERLNETGCREAVSQKNS